MTPVVDPLYALAEVCQVSPSAALILTAGQLTVQVLHQFENACHWYFSMKDVDAVDHVGKIIYNFESSVVQSWIMAEEAQLIALSFPQIFSHPQEEILATYLGR